MKKKKNGEKSINVKKETSEQLKWILVHAIKWMEMKKHKKCWVHFFKVAGCVAIKMSYFEIVKTKQILHFFFYVILFHFISYFCT